MYVTNNILVVTRKLLNSHRISHIIASAYNIFNDAYNLSMKILFISLQVIDSSICTADCNIAWTIGAAWSSGMAESDSNTKTRKRNKTDVSILCWTAGKTSQYNRRWWQCKNLGTTFEILPRNKIQKNQNHEIQMKILIKKILASETLVNYFNIW